MESGIRLEIIESQCAALSKAQANDGQILGVVEQVVVQGCRCRQFLLTWGLAEMVGPATHPLGLLACLIRLTIFIRIDKTEPKDALETWKSAGGPPCSIIITLLRLDQQPGVPSH